MEYNGRLKLTKPLIPPWGRLFGGSITLLIKTDCVWGRERLHWPCVMAQGAWPCAARTFLSGSSSISSGGFGLMSSR